MSLQGDPIVIVSAARSPMGGFQGELTALSSTDLGAHAIKHALSRAAIKPDQIQGVLMGCVLPAGLGQAPARQAALKSGLLQSTESTTVNKMCGSGLKAVMLAHDLIAAGTNDILIAGGMESMTNAPYLLPKARGGYRMGHGQIIDHMFLDGLEDAYDTGKLMGHFAENCARDYNFTRQAQDEFAIQSLRRAQNTENFSAEIAAITIADKKGEIIVSTDEQPRKAAPDKIPMLKPAFAKDGTVTAANASSISDGAAALVLMRLSQAEKLGLKPLAKITGHATHAHAPALFTTAPVGALQKLSDKTGLSLKDVDLFEINEAFAVVTLAAMKDLSLPHEKVNIHGGACALGHPIGASGARILTTLLYALQKHDLKTGMAALCIGGGEAVAMAVERMD